MFRSSAVILSIGLAMMLGCGLFSGGREDVDDEVVLPPAVTATPSVMVLPTPIAQESEGLTPLVVSGTSPSMIETSSPLYIGPTLLEERIFNSPVITRVRLDTASSTVESATAPDGSTKYVAILEFSFTVFEYLRGTGGTDIVAVWESRPVFDTRQEAEAAQPEIAASRDTRWDDHEAIVFLKHSQTYLASTQQSDRYYLTWQHEIEVFDDKYSLASRHSKLWLPAETAIDTPSQPSGDQQRFLLDVPSSSGSAPTITLGELKARIAAVTAKLAAGASSEEYMECVTESYFLERLYSHLRETQPESLSTGSNISPPPIHQFDSGLPYGSVVYQLAEGSDITPGVPIQVWLDGGDASFFHAVTPSQNFRVSTSRPLIEEEYNFYFNHRGPFYSLCDGWAVRYEWTVTVNAPDGVLHEAFFDPVTIGSAVAADNTNGVLKPATFADANGATTTIERIAWEAGAGESGTVKMRLTPLSGIAGHIVDFIALDGSVALTLNVADATLDAANDTLSWTVTSRPWQIGDKLMLRIREADR